MIGIDDVIRKPGHYWVKQHVAPYVLIPDWEVAHWDGNVWHICAWDSPVHEPWAAEIDPRRIEDYMQPGNPAQVVKTPA